MPDPIDAASADEYWNDLYNSPTKHGVDVLWDHHGPDPVLVATMRDRKRDGQRSESALDLGCGEGNDAIFLMQQNFSDATCLDASRAALDIAEERAGSSTLSASALKRLSFVHAFLGADGETPLGSTPRYDLVWIRSVLQHLSNSDVVGVLRYVRSLLRDGGTLLAKEMVSCPAAAVVSTEALQSQRWGSSHCHQSLSPIDFRPAKELLELVRMAFPSCVGSNSSFEMQCDGTHLCAQLHTCRASPPSPPTPAPRSAAPLPLPPVRKLDLLRAEARLAGVVLGVCVLLVVAAWLVRRRPCARASRALAVWATGERRARKVQDDTGDEPNPLLGDADGPAPGAAG